MKSFRVEHGAFEHYADPACYARTYRSRRHDIQYYSALAGRTGGPVLECGIGNGRIALPIVRQGIEVMGIDLSAPMLADLEKRASRLAQRYQSLLSWVHGDMRRVRLGRRFALVIAPFNVVLHLYERGDIEAFLARVREHLAPGAPLVFDYSVPIPGDLAEDSGEWRRGPRLRHPDSGQLLRYRERFDYDPVRQVLLVDMEYEPPSGPPWSVPLTHRQFFPQEMAALLHYNGFEADFTGDFTDAPPSPSVDALIVTARVAVANRRGRS